MSDHDVTEAARRYRSGCSLSTVASVFHVDTATVRREFHRAGITIRLRPGWLIAGAIDAVRSGHAGARMSSHHVKDRLEGALHRGGNKAPEDELAEITAVVLAIVGELTIELAALNGELSDRVAALEGR